MPYFKNLDSTFLAIVSAEASAYHERWVRNGRLGEYGTDVKMRIHVGFPLLATQYLKAQRARAVITESFARLLRGTVDILATPTITVGTPLLGQEIVSSPRGEMPVLSALTLITRPFNLIGFPAISIPCGFVEGRLPAGLQLAAAPLREALLMHAAASFQEVTDFHTKIPPLA